MTSPFMKQIIVFDRLQPIGVCLSYGHGLTILDKFSGNFNSAVIDALKDEKRIRLVGDNINWKTNVHDERQDNHGKMHHAFGSAVIVQTLSFENISRIKPQKLFYEVDHQLFLPSSDEWKHIKEEYAIHMLHVAFKHIPYFKIFEKLITKQIVGQYSEQLKKKNKVFPLPVLHLNEQKYDDVVQIMDYYENFLSDTYEKAGLDFNNNTHVHCGGDQLTRERYSGAKRLRSGAATPSNRFEHLSPITFELFHMQMNYVKLIFKRLYSEEGLQEQGTLKCEANRVLRTNLNPNVNDHFDADKDFIVSFTDAYIVEAITHFFDMESLFSAPRKNALPDNVCTENQKKEWVMDMFQQIVEIYVWDKENKQNQEDNVEVDGVVIPIQLSNGKRRSYVIKKAQKSQTPQEDKVKNYGHLCLELGLQFKAILDLCKLPDRERGLRLLKVCMIHFKANNNLSKYAYAILRLLVHQLCILSEQEAHEEFYGLFVNTKGKIDSHIPCDLQMEYIVKSVKRNIKHMFSNKTDKNITTRTSALPAIKDIADNFDKTSGVIIRCKKHSSIDAIKDELDIIFDLQNVNPFTFTAGRSHDSFKTISSRMDKLLDVHHFHSWIESNVYKHATELGN
ncbi:uncharacterized protein [Mytilus edulis]|uniref:uncharacterized protein n=1 Tax=Mytilus edulis TaxID=6550 RepID=UPI0039EF2F02